MSKDRSRLLALVVCVIVSRAAGAPATIRGVDPKVASRYSNQHGAFACFSGHKTVPIQRVNDNYCDCPDGSDEPGEFLPRTNQGWLHAGKGDMLSVGRQRADVRMPCRHVSVPGRQVLLPQPRACAAHRQLLSRGRRHLWYGCNAQACQICSTCASDGKPPIPRAITAIKLCVVPLAWQLYKLHGTAAA